MTGSKKGWAGLRRLLACMTVILIGAACLPGAGKALAGEQAQEDREVLTVRPSVNGALHVEGTDLVDEKGEPAVLRGLSTHGLTWYPEYVSESLFRQVSEDWNCNLIRLAMYSELYCGGDKEESLEVLFRGIEAAIAADQYVLVDWHILKDSNPLDHAGEAAAFFDMIAERYQGVPNILYEICNEPNGKTGWKDITTYADRIVPVIRARDPDAVIIVGTPEYDRDLMVAALNPLPYDNLMYTCHFYTASHYDELFSEMRAAREMGLPVFITECGLSEESGDGRLDLENAAVWFSYLDQEKMSYAVWSLSGKAETSAFLVPSYDPERPLTDSSLTPAGLWGRDLIRGMEPGTIPVPDSVRKSLPERIAALFTAIDRQGLAAVRSWPVLALLVLAIGLALCGAAYAAGRPGREKILTYDAYLDRRAGKKEILRPRQILNRAAILVSSLFSLLYLCWRIGYSIPFRYGIFAVIANLALLAVELLGLLESLAHYRNVLFLRDHPLPEIPEEAWPEVDIFIATYNEPEDLLRRTIRGCLYLSYPDKSKVHIWICDDNRRPSMRALAEEMGVGYFDRPDNKGAKAGNLNAAMKRTSAPYVVTLDADMIPRSDFLLKTIPYFVDVELKNEGLPEEDRVHLGLLQTPQCFYDPDVFQHALYSEKRIPNEQDLFYRTIEPARTATNSVIYGGSNTVLSRRALEAAGGFYTESITEDFATGLLIESAGFLSLALSEPLASGRTPHTFREHIQQRTRWGRGVIVTGRKLGIFRRKGLTPAQKLSYWGSVVYWYSPVKNMIYMLSPLLFAVFGLPVFRCSWVELLLYWLPMFLFQELSLRLTSGNTASTKWAGIYEISVMPLLLVPLIQEILGISLTAFKVTDKGGGSLKKIRDMRLMAPFLVLIGLSLFGIVRTLLLIRGVGSLGLFILLFWMIRNLYYLLLALFLADGRDSDGEPVHVRDAEPVLVRPEGAARPLEGITTHLTEHSVSFLVDEGELKVGDYVHIEINTGVYRALLTGPVTRAWKSRPGGQSVCGMEILDMGNTRDDYFQILYDRIPTLPQNLNRDIGILPHLWGNIAVRLSQTTRL